MGMASRKIIERDASANILEAASMYPVVTLCGPRLSITNALFPDAFV